MSTRVWRALAEEASQPPPNDSVIRLALASMAADPTSPLTSVQRQWLIALVERTTPLAPGERERLREPLLTWIKARMPRCVDIITAQFGGPDAEHGT